MFDLAGKTVGKYRLVEKLGQGGMAQVYKAYQPDLDRYVAVKILHPHLTGDPEFEARFRREARAVAALEHPNIVRIYDFDTAEGLAFLVMECVEGTNLRTRLRDMAGRGELLGPGRGGPHRRRPGRRPRLCPPPGRRPPRPQAVQRPDRRGGAACPQRLWHRPHVGCHRHHRQRQHAGHPGLHVARAGPGRAGRRPLRHLCPGRPPLPAVHRPRPL